MYGLDFDYAGTRLDGTLVRDTKGFPLWVMQVRASGNCYVAYLKDDDTLQEKELHIDDLDLRPVSLGYCNYSGRANYISRVPMRRDWKQGLRANNVIIYDGGDFNQIPRSSLKNTIMGKYPSLTTCIRDTSPKTAREKPKSLAFHRHWAIKSGSKVLYKFNQEVGYVDDGNICLHEGFWHLKEYLERCLK